MKKRYIVYIILLIGLGYLIYHRINAQKKVDKIDTKKGGMALSVEGRVVKNVSFANKLEISGVIEANEQIDLRSEVAGLITHIYFKEGSNVAKGALLVKINDRDLQAQLKDAQTKQLLAASNENRAKQLLAQGAISQEEYDTTLATLQSLKAQTQLINAQLAKTNIVAPFSGRVGLRNISVGGYVSPTTPIARLASLNPVKITFSVPEKYASYVKVNSTIYFTTDASNKTHAGQVYAIEPNINQQTRTLQIRAMAQNQQYELLPGAFANIKLNLAVLPKAILIPSEAIIPVLNGKMVYIAKNGKAQSVKVEAGIRTADSVLINSGLHEGDTVLTTGAMSLKPEAKVKVKIIK